MNEALLYTAQDCGLEVAATAVRESGERIYDSQLEQCLELLQEGGAEVVLIERQAPKPFVEDLEAVGFIVAQLDVMSTRGEEDGAEGYFEAQRATRAHWRSVCARRKRGIGELKEVVIYTDGACSGNPGPGGWGAILIYKDVRLELSGYEAHTTKTAWSCSRRFRRFRASRNRARSASIRTARISSTRFASAG